jgi:phosphatidylserine/phosphatidylglycerophosphate/cardiolipin synthase-like enzyme
MSKLGQSRSNGGDELVLVFRPPENPAAQMAADTPFKGHRISVEELLDWFKDFKVDSIELWIEGAWKTGNRTELFLSIEGKTGAKVTLKPLQKGEQVATSPDRLENSPLTTSAFSPSQVQLGNPTAEPVETNPKPMISAVTAYFSPRGGVEQQILTMITGAAQTIEMAAYAFTNDSIAKGLSDAIKRGVKVALVMDRNETVGAQASIHDELEKAGTEIRLLSPLGGIMHNKFIIVDGKKVEWGSYNYTDRAENVNFENATFLTDDRLALKYHSDFMSIYQQATPEVHGVGRPIRRFLRSLVSRQNE